MGKATAAALTAAAPEAAVARKITTSMSRDEINGELQRRRSEARRKKTAAPNRATGENWGPNEEAGYQAERRRQAAEAAPPPSSPGGGSAPSVVVPAAASTGSGFLLGVFVWAVGLAYLRNGPAGVKQFFNAKFLNKA